MSIIKSGKKQEFSTGAHRDTQSGKGRFDLIPTIALKRLARHYESGANEYGENNWKYGIPLRRFLDSSLRHIIHCLDNKDDEDHAAAVLWNICAFIYTKDAIDRGILPEKLNNLDNLPTKKIDDLSSSNLDEYESNNYEEDQTSKENNVFRGVAIWFDSVKGIGRIKMKDGREIYVHQSYLPKDETLIEGNEYEFKIYSGAIGEYASNIVKL